MARPRIVLGAGIVVLALIGVGAVSRFALISVVLDGLFAFMIIAPVALGGLWFLPLLGITSVPLRWHFLIGAALGIGAASLLMLAMGLMGLLPRPLWIGLLVSAGIAGVIRCRSLLDGARVRGHAPRRDTPASEASRGLEPVARGTPVGRGDSTTTLGREDMATSRWDRNVGRFLWFVVTPFLSLALIASATAPGFIWQEEGYGYDVLEYHLQMPKEYFRHGKIDYAPHNVYANFPAGVEMLYLLNMVILDDDVDTGTVANMTHLVLALLTVFAAWVIGRDWSPRTGMLCAVTLGTVNWLGYLSGLAYVENGMLFFGLTSLGALLQSAPTGKSPSGGGPGGATTGGHLPWITVAGLLAGLACGCKYTGVPMIAAPLFFAAIILPHGPVGGRMLRRRIVAGGVFGMATLATFSPWLVKNQVMTGNPVFPLVNDVFRATPPGWDDNSTARWNEGHSLPEQQRSFTARLGAMWTYIPGDHYQRFGPAILLLAIGGLVGRKRDRVDGVLLLILVVQLAVWLFATHLYARFAVVLLIPLTVLAGRAVLGEGHRFRRRSWDDTPRGVKLAARGMPAVRGRRATWSPRHGEPGLRWVIAVTVITIGAGWNLAYAIRLHREESSGGVPASLMYEGEVPGYEYFSQVNRNLPSDAKVLLVGDAKAFYFRRSVDYCVVFNASPFIEAAREQRDIADWLRDRGYTHVLVHWAEIRRLRRSYGFSAVVKPALFERTGGQGLSLVREFAHPASPARYITLYEVPRQPERFSSIRRTVSSVATSGRPRCLQSVGSLHEPPCLAW